jgi:hypothetical protein
MAAGQHAKSLKIQIQISNSLHQQLSRAASSSGISKSAFVRVALEREFAYDQQLALECNRRKIPAERNQQTFQNQPRLF